MMRTAGPDVVWIAPITPERPGFDKIIIFPFSEKCKEKAGVFKLILCFAQKGAPPSGGTHSVKLDRLWSERLRVR